MIAGTVNVFICSICIFWIIRCNTSSYASILSFNMHTMSNIVKFILNCLLKNESLSTHVKYILSKVYLSRPQRLMLRCHQIINAV